ncbi:Y-family DNA polymerase [Endozoicomonas sp. GU-1]|uniref:Y-family DNA polymerase n=1 Tax=Endozoicomonas sp. GU-1 TaxID=3009078 RepID=UPI0022B37DF8|nr:Y-family DNA polymerase [Endozoicomonas sp. GU-1]WBA83242.1 Y-family DNA polymerase [Endozoicomonas sp. GU-1]WBA86168.1 Y-family DNA polymerase [Endozoicomonas sp. GU-1]
MKDVIALCDANAFYCSCEQVFNPSLLGKALGVLSNNDGCIVARTAQLKALGVAMGTPAFKVRDQVARGEIILKSSNYALYGDMSSRFMSVLEQFSPKLEVYSIDEAFVELSGFPLANLHAIGLDMKRRVFQWTGLPIGVGISTTKTLAKLANYAAKKFPATGGVVDLTSPIRQQRLMAITPVGEVWGVGRRIEKRLEAAGIHTAAQLANANRRWVRKQFSVVLERTVCELQGEYCIPWEEGSSANKHQIMCSRSFGQRVTTRQALHAALASFICRACEKLRKQQQYSREAIIFIRTDPFKANLPQTGRSLKLMVPSPTSDSSVWLQQLNPALGVLFQEGYEYKKAGFALVDLCSCAGFQGDLLTAASIPENTRMMTVLDAINQRFGSQTLRPASVGFRAQPWHMNQQVLSPSYTTQWPEIMKVQT